jgi:hypothetical protein
VSTSVPNRLRLGSPRPPLTMSRRALAIVVLALLLCSLVTAADDDGVVTVLLDGFSEGMRARSLQLCCFNGGVRASETSSGPVAAPSSPPEIASQDPSDVEPSRAALPSHHTDTLVASHSNEDDHPDTSDAQGQGSATQGVSPGNSEAQGSDARPHHKETSGEPSHEDGSHGEASHGDASHGGSSGSEASHSGSKGGHGASACSGSHGGESESEEGHSLFPIMRCAKHWHAVVSPAVYSPTVFAPMIILAAILRRIHARSSSGQTGVFDTGRLDPRQPDEPRDADRVEAERVRAELRTQELEDAALTRGDPDATARRAERALAEVTARLRAEARRRKAQRMHRARALALDAEREQAELADEHASEARDQVTELGVREYGAAMASMTRMQVRRRVVTPTPVDAPVPATQMWVV